MSESTKPIRSMTGFARTRQAVSDGELVVSVKSLNHRGLDPRFHVPVEIEPFENDMRTLLAKRVRRGHIDIRVSFQRKAGADAIGLNRPLLEAYITAFRTAAAEHGINAEPDLGLAFRTPGMLAEPVEEELGASFRDALLAALGAALDDLNRFRAREGAQLVADIAVRLGNIRRSAARVEEIRDTALPAFQNRLRERLTELLNGANIEPQRLVQEAAVLADRSDIGEELARLKIHAEQVGAMLDAGGEIGKRLDFLLQEMQREANTILSKTSGVGEMGLEITDLGLATKSDIEKIREQALNLE